VGAVAVLPLTRSPPIPDRNALNSFEELYRGEVRAVTSFFARRTRDPETVADLTADTFVEAMRSFGSFDPSRGAPRQWVFGIARRVYAKHLERAERRRDATARLLSRELLDDDDIQELTERIDAEAPGRALLDRMAHLSPLEREAIELVDLVGMTPKEAAGTLGVAPTALRVRLFRARAHLREGGER